MRNNKDISVIPKGLYCYTIKKIVHDANRGSIIETNPCPYCTTKMYGETEQPFCSFLEKGSIHNNTTENEYEKILKYFDGDENKLKEELSLFLLWDGVKECGINDEEDF